MHDQLSHDEPIWDLTPTELLIAYWSLTLTKLDIADLANISEGTVGTHLTRIYAKLGLSKLDDEVKRSLLNSRHGESLNSIVKDIDEEFVNYVDKIKALQKKKSDTLKGKKVAASSSAKPGMQSPPPSPQPQSQFRPPIRGGRVPRRVWFIGGILVLLGIFGLFSTNLVNLLNQTPANTLQTSTSAVSNNTERVPAATETLPPTQTVEPPATETLTSIPPTQTKIVLPTAVPLPIVEHFNKPMSDVWKITGDPFLGTAQLFSGMGFDGVLTAPENQYASIATGNQEWTDYIIHIIGSNTIAEFTLGFRVKDLNNMVALECNALNCGWIVYKDGRPDLTRPARGTAGMYPDLTLTIQGTKFTALSDYDLGFEDIIEFLDLPSKYQGEYQNGGVYLRFKNIEIDYIEILPLQ